MMLFRLGLRHKLVRLLVPSGGYQSVSPTPKGERVTRSLFYWKNMKKTERANILKAAAMRSRKIGLMLTLSKKTNQQIADSFKNNKVSFLNSAAWKELRKNVIKTYGHKCMKCGDEPNDKRKVNVDHIKPRKFYPDLALCFDNLQILCAGCNKAKGNKNQTDYRKV